MAEPLVSIHRARPRDLLASEGRWLNAPKPTRQKPLIISASELGTFLRCRVKHHWSTQLESVQFSEARGIGILAHEIVEAYYRLPIKQRLPLKMLKLAKRMTKHTDMDELSTADRNLIVAMCEGFARWSRAEDNEMNDRAIGLRDVFPEEWFEVPLNKEKTIWVRGKFDLRFRPTNDKHAMALQEVKTRGQFKDEYIENLLQLTVYLYALLRKYPKLERYIVYFTRMRKQMPTARVTAPLFDRQEIDRDREYLIQWAEDASHAALDMLDGSVYPNPMDSCAWMCEFKEACLMRGNPADLKHVLTTQFKPREKR